MPAKNGVEAWVDNWRFPGNPTPNDATNAPLALILNSSIKLAMNGDSIATPSTFFDAARLWEPDITLEDTIYGFVILAINIILLLTNLLIIVVILTSNTLRDVIGAYFVSLSMSDILLSTLVLPLSVYASFNPSWRYIVSESNGLCKLESYLGILLITTNVCTFMWISVDRFAVLKKPARYEVEQTFTRCKCWILFSWITSILLCCPTLFTNMAKYYPEVKLCMNNWSKMPAYSATLGALIILPPLLGVIYTYSYIFHKFQRLSMLEQAQRCVLENDSNILAAFVTIVVFTITWLPWFCLRSYETLQGEVQSGVLHFSLLWLGISGGCWRFFIYCLMNPDFRTRVGRVFKRVFCCCCFRSRYSEYNNISGEGERYL